MKKLSFVIPCYRSEHTIERVIEEIKFVVAQRTEYDYEIIAVNDCSPDEVYSVLRQMAAGDPKIKVINFAKNMGKHAAVLAGYAVAKGEYIVNLDDDLPCPVNELWKLVEPLENEGYDIVTAEYIQKRESCLKRMGSQLNSWMSKMMLEKPRGMRLENFNVMKAYVAKEIIKYKNPYPYLEGLILQITHSVKMVLMDERERGDDNTTGFTLRKSILLFINGLTSFSVKPLRIGTIMGFLFSFIGFIVGLAVVIKKIINPQIVMGWTSVTAIMLFSTGMILLMLGLIGEYVGRIYICINASAQYVVKETINIEKHRGDNE